MAEPTSSGLTLGAVLLATYSAILAGFVDGEWLRVIFCALVGSMFGILSVDHAGRWQKIAALFGWWGVGIIFAAPTCFILTKFTHLPFQTWPGFVACAGTWFMAWFLENFKGDLKGWMKLLIDALVKRLSAWIGGGK